MDGYRFAEPATATQSVLQVLPNAEIEIGDIPAEAMSVATPIAVGSPIPSLQRESEQSPPIAAPLARGAAAERPPALESASVQVSHGDAKTTSKGLLLGIAGAVVLGATGVGGYIYWSGKPSRPNVPPVAGTNAALVATPAAIQAKQTAVAASVPQVAAPSGPPEQLEKVDAAKIHQHLTQQLGRAGFSAVNVTVDTEGGVAMDGAVANKKAKDEAVRIAFAEYGVERVDESDLLLVPAVKASNPSPQRDAVASPYGPLPVRPATPQLCLLYTSPSPRDRTRSRMPSSA